MIATQPISAPAQQNGINWSELRQAYCVFRSNPAQGILHILAAGQHSAWQRWVMARLARQAAHLKDAEIHLDIAALAQLPGDTLGGAYARHILSQGLNPEAFVREESTENWLAKRLAISHDIHHVITGFDASPVGEFGLAGFALAQSWNLLNVFVLSHLPLVMLSQPETAVALMRATLKGFWMGLTSPPIVAYPFEANWYKPLVQVRQEVGL